MTRNEEIALIEDVALIKARLLGDKLTGTPSLIDDVEDLKAKSKKSLKVRLAGFFKLFMP